MDIKRRDFLKATAATAAAATIVGTSGKKILRALSVSKAEASSPDKWVPSVCHNCPGGCGILVRVVNGKAVRVQGNPNHPLNEGKICPKGDSGVQFLYDPDRVKGPMKRTNQKKGPDEDPKFVSVSWDEALNDIASRLKKIRAEGKSHTVAAVGGRYRGHGHSIVAKFLTLYGSPNDLGHSSICADASKKARKALDGNDSYCAYDWENVNYVLNMGAGFLEAFRPTSRLLVMFGKMRSKKERVKFVTFEPRMSVTAARSDEWYMINPGTDGAAAIAMAHVILTEGLWNKKFVGKFKSPDMKFVTGKTVDPKDFEEKWTHGLIDWWNNVVKDFTPKKAAEITGVPEKDLVKVAREFATTRPQIAVSERGAGAHTNGAYNHMAIHALNALVGNSFAFGGYIYQEKPKYGKWPADEKEFIDDIAKKVAAEYKDKKLYRMDKKGTKKWPFVSNVYQEIADNHMKGDPYKLSVLFAIYTNPLYSQPDPKRAYEAFKDVFCVETSSYISEFSTYADYILPDHSYLEKWLDDPIYPSTGYPVTGLRQPVVAPLYDTKSYTNVFIELGKRMGGKMAEYFTKIESDENIVKHLAKGFGNFKFEDWAARGVWYDKHYPYRQENGVFYENGIPMDVNAVAKKCLKTKSGKFEFRSSMLEGKGFNPYPHYEKEIVAGEKEGYDIRLMSPKVITTAEGRGTSSPWLLDRYVVYLDKGVFDEKNKAGWIEMPPDLAKKIGVKEGDTISVKSIVGEVKGKALIAPWLHPKTVLISWGLGHKQYGRWGKDRGINPNYLLANLSEPISAQSCTYSTNVKVSKA